MHFTVATQSCCHCAQTVVVVTDYPPQKLRSDTCAIFNAQKQKHNKAYKSLTSQLKLVNPEAA